MIMEDFMGYSKKRLFKSGVRYTACYKDARGSLRSAGTFTSKKAADRAWQRAESKLAEGRLGDPARGRRTFQDYVEETWLPHHQMETSTRESYTYSIHKHLIPEFGPRRMAEILPEHVRAWITKLQADGVSPRTIKYNKTILSAIFTTAMDDQVVFIHPCRGVRTPPVPKKPFQIITPEQFDTLYDHLSHPDYQLLIETEIESGLRWGELTELRVKDLSVTFGILTISRAVVEVSSKFHPNGERFLIKDYPKDREYRRLSLSPQVIQKLDAHIRANALTQEDLIFARRHSPTPVPPPAPDPDSLGFTPPNAKGRSYRHATLSAYTAGGCRCTHCRTAFATYRATRRHDGKDTPRRPRPHNTGGHISRNWFRTTIWHPAITAADLGFTPTMRDLRHAHASWLLAGGADLQVVKERLGHSTIATTERYLHTLPNADRTALNALARTRNRR